MSNSKLLILALCCSQAWGALAVVGTPAVGQNTSGSSVGTIAAAAASHTTGNLIAVGIRWGVTAVTVTGVADTALNSYTALTKYSGTGGWQWWYAKNITGNAANVVTVTFSATTNFPAVIVYQVSGANATSPVDVGTDVGSSVGSGGSPQTYTSPLFTTSNANDIILFGVTVGALGETMTAGTIGGVTALLTPSGASNPIAAAEYLVVSSIQSSITATITASAGASGVYSVIAFKAAVSTASRLPLLGVGP